MIGERQALPLSDSLTVNIQGFHASKSFCLESSVHVQNVPSNEEGLALPACDTDLGATGIAGGWRARTRTSCTPASCNTSGTKFGVTGRQHQPFFI